MGKTKAFQAAIEQLKQQKDFSFFNNSPPPTPSPVPAILPSKRPKCDIPEDLDLENVYNPKYTVIQLISTRRKPQKQAMPPRPPNSFFLFKNCYMLELRKLGYRYCMPDVCRQSKKIWSNISPEVKERYDILALQAQILHQEMYPGYKFSPKKRQVFKPHVFSDKTVVDSSMMSTFSVTNFLGNNTNNSTGDYFENVISFIPSPPGTPSTISSTSSETINPVDYLLLNSYNGNNSYNENNYNGNNYNSYYPLDDVLIPSPPVPSTEPNGIYQFPGFLDLLNHQVA